MFVCMKVLSRGRFNCSCSDLDVMRSTLLVLVMNLTAFICVRCTKSKLELQGIRVGRMRVVYCLRLFLVSRCLNLFSLMRYVLAIAFRMFIWLCIPVYEKLSFSIFPLFVYG